jgi:hypothetical protein
MCIELNSVALPLQDLVHLFTEDRLWVLDRNFPGVERIAQMLATGTHALIRIKSDIPLKRIGDYADDRSGAPPTRPAPQSVRTRPTTLRQALPGP